jgi:hypothetical protein
MAYFFKILNVLFLSTIKYFYTPIYAHMIGMDMVGTMVTMLTGGVLGFLVYYHFSKIVIISTKHIKPIARTIIPDNYQEKYRKRREKRQQRRKNRKRFSWRNRMLVKLGNNYGMYSIIILTPVLISLILGAFLLRKYYSDRKEAVPLMIVSIVVEGSLLVIGYWYMVGAL